jgi:2-desacetyl-2-hydroxyethyl bacteriochlorophyllide A dehydrogenase
MKAAVVEAPGELRVLEVADPVPGPGQVLVRVDLCGVCGTDIHVRNGEHPAVRFPVIPGHEFVGTVVAHASPSAPHPPIGSTVAVDPMVTCGHCEMCRNGHSNLCFNGGGLGTTAPGAFAELIAVDAAQCQLLPEGMPVEWGAVIEPLSCVVHAVDRLGPVVGSEALVVGAGPVGLFLTRLLSIAGARVDLVERNPDRLAVGEHFGAARRATDIADLDQPGLWEVVVDATGSPAAIEAALTYVRRAGRFGMFGVTAADATISLQSYQVFAKELTIIGSNSVNASFGRATSLIAGGQFGVARLLADPLPLDRVGEAFERTSRGAGLKAVVSPSGRF